ncbi:MAG TPA: glycosyltransferase family 39 protein [Candidatus Aquilonibacter sp.]|nr:glycosyltransferase family 39 protein [Candidatus Aquilonibacter sp.]
MTNRSRIDFLLLAGFCAFLFFYGLAQFGLIGADEPRYAQVSREMLEHHDWITPTLGGQPWLEKPPLYYWQAILAYKIFGVSDWAARLPSAFDGTFLVFAVYFFLGRFSTRSGSGAALDGALVVASCAGVIGYARAASTDMPLAAAFGIAMLAWWSWRESGKRTYLALFFFLIALGTLAKGPVAPFLAAVVIVLYAVAARESRLVLKTFWPPGILLFCAVALPWYFAVQVRNPQFFHEFILEQNLGRFSHNIYHHVQPFWYYLPVTTLAVIPWTVFVIAAFIRMSQNWWSNRKTPAESREKTEKRVGGIKKDEQIQAIDPQFGLFACCWLIVPIMFFSASASKLPGYILPAIPAAGLLVAIYLLKNLQAQERSAKMLSLLHAMVATAPLVPALLIAYLITQHRLPCGRPLVGAIAIAALLCVAIAFTLLRKNGFRLLRLVTLIPVVLSVAAVLKLGSATIDQTMSARPLAQELAGIETHPLPLAVYHVRRELEYGLTFYRNQLTINYAWGRIPPEDHLLVAPGGSQLEIAKLVPGRRVSFLGEYQPQHLDYFWISAATNSSP